MRMRARAWFPALFLTTALFALGACDEEPGDDPGAPGGSGGSGYGGIGGSGGPGGAGGSVGAGGSGGTGGAEEPDLQPPAVEDVMPPHGAEEVSRATKVTVLFTEAMEPEPTAGAVHLLDAGGAEVPVSRQWLRPDLIELTPLELLAPGALYRVRVSGEARDPAGNFLVDPPFESQFQTGESAEPPGVWGSLIWGEGKWQ